MKDTFKVEEVDLKNLSKGSNLTHTERAMLANEYTIQKAEKALLLKNIQDKLTRSDLDSIFHVIGFNTKTYWAGLHGAAANYTYNIDGYVIPGWKQLSLQFTKLFPLFKKTLLTRFAPGRRRFHIRVFQKSESEWYLIAHVDILNWIVPTKKAYDSHHKDAQGDLVLGHMILEIIMQEIIERIEKRSELSEIDVDGIYQKLVSIYSIDKNRKFNPK